MTQTTKITIRPNAKNECGKEYKGMVNSCPRCNDSAHYHYENGSCDMEPCVRHSGPR
jgi:hypothetical protein